MGAAGRHRGGDRSALSVAARQTGPAKGRAGRGALTAAVVVAPGRVELSSAELPEAGPADALIRIEGCGICASSLPLWEGREWFEYPFPPGAPGHEPWGEVESGPREIVGRRVAFLSDRACAARACPLARRWRSSDWAFWDARPPSCAAQQARTSSKYAGATSRTESSSG